MNPIELWWHLCLTTNKDGERAIGELNVYRVYDAGCVPKVSADISVAVLVVVYLCTWWMQSNFSPTKNIAFQQQHSDEICGSTVSSISSNL